MAVGADYRLSPDARLGFALSGGATNFALSGGLGSGRSDFIQAGVYGQERFGPAYAALALAYGAHSFTTERATGGLGFEDLQASFVSQTVAGRIEGGYRFGFAGLGGFGATPYAAYQVQHMMIPAYAESSFGPATTALAFAANDTTASRTEAGAWFDQAFGGGVMLRARAAWVHEFNRDTTATPTFESLPGATFVVNGVPRPADSVLLSGVAEYHVTRDVVMAAKIDGELASHAGSYAATGSIRFVW
jgi:uncharacterized protein with beta-barrel porin domain